MRLEEAQASLQLLNLSSCSDIKRLEEAQASLQLQKLRSWSGFHAADDVLLPRRLPFCTSYYLYQCIRLATRLNFCHPFTLLSIRLATHPGFCHPFEPLSVKMATLYTADITSVGLLGGRAASAALGYNPPSSGAAVKDAPGEGYWFLDSCPGRWLEKLPLHPALHITKPHREPSPDAAFLLTVIRA